jgi:tetratricopeptide (TPR) repeat protein
LALLALLALEPRTSVAQAQVRLASNDTSATTAVARADRAYAAQRWNEAAELYQWAAAEDMAADRWWSMAQALFNARRHREAIAAFERALQLGAGEPAYGAWQIARAYAHRGNRKQALRWLARAADLGFDARDAIRQEPQFEQYRDDPRFSVIADPASGSRRSPRRLPAGTRHAPVREVEPAHLAAAHPFDAREQAVGPHAPIDHALREVMGEVLEAHLVAGGA